MINKYSTEPLYSQLKSIILKKIDSGEYREDEKIPSEIELCKEFNISRPTVRQAVSELTNNGYLYKVRGKGTFVAKTKKRIDIKDYAGFTPSVLDCKNPENRIVLRTRIINDADAEIEKLRNMFNISSYPHSKVEFAEILYQFKNGSEIFSINTSYIPNEVFPNIINDIIECKASHEILKGKYPLVPEKTKSMLEVIYSSQEDTTYLQIQSGQPLIKIENMIFSKSGRLVEYVIAKYRADKCRFIFENLIK